MNRLHALLAAEFAADCRQAAQSLCAGVARLQARGEPLVDGPYLSDAFLRESDAPVVLIRGWRYLGFLPSAVGPSDFSPPAHRLLVARAELRPVAEAIRAARALAKEVGRE